MFSRRRWNYESNCAAIVCYVSTGLATSTTQLTELSEDIIKRHSKLAKQLTADHIEEILTYTLNRILKGHSTKSHLQQSSDTTNTSATMATISSTPVIHFKIFYQVNAAPSIDLLINAINDFREKNTAKAKFAYTVLPASSLQNFSTFISICGIKH